MSVAWMASWNLAAVRPVIEGFLVIVLLLAFALSRGSRDRDVHRRGARIEPGRAAQRRTARLQLLRHKPPLTLAGIGIPAHDEVKHFKLIGTTGTGKSTAIRELLASALYRGDRAVITDPDGGYLARFHDPGRGDVILNPFDWRSARWDPFAEIRAPYDAEQLASSLVPSTEDASGREWRGYARTFLAAVVRRCHEIGCHDVAGLWRLIAMAPSAELRPIVAGTPAQPFLEPENARMFGSIRSVAGSAAAALEHVQAQRARAFSVRNWIDDGRGVLFLPYQASQIAALRTIIATWVRLAIFQALCDESTDRRLWLIVDELDALGAIDGLKDALARLRKFGGRCVLGFQSISQVSSTYGGEAQTLVENCGNTLILRCSASEHGGTSQFASRLIGEREVARRSTSRGRDGGGLFDGRGWRRSMSVSEQRITEAAVLPSELEQLPDLTGYLKRASSAVWLRVRLRRECH
ncbi:MAG TPA: type IV secretion system DNA-binding domain-containing protein [Steroidobacteraceae bacterium]|nr:type IV secretion system DNA-binding domain-containing protein [Steroidobacteraceae bacterium]